MTIGALLIDLDGVLRIWEPERASTLERRYGVPQGTLSRAFRRELVSLPCTGACSHQEWLDRFALEVSQVCGQADALIAEWQAHRGVIDPAVLALVRELRQTVPVVLVTNATDWLDRDLATLGLVSEVDAVVNSSRLGVAKPDAAIYRHAAAVAGTTADRCVFVDDQPEYVEGARMVGMRAILYMGLDAMRRELASMGYLRPARDRE